MTEDGITVSINITADELWQRMVAVVTSDIWDLESLELLETEEQRHLREDDEIPL